MSPAPNQPDELNRLLSALEDGTLESSEEARLAELLKTDAQARARYYNHAMLAALLRREGCRSAAQSGPAVRTRRTYLPGSRLWLAALAATVLLMLALSVGEATGVTQFVPTIVRVVTGEGALVIEVDDPTVSVTLDGQDVRITGAGIHELRLQPGTHKFIATKNGQPLHQEVVTIERGGRQVVKVTRETAADSIPPELTASEKLEAAKKLWDEANELYDQAQPLRGPDPVEAERLLRRALAIYETLAKDFPGATKYQQRLGACRWALHSALNIQVQAVNYRGASAKPEEVQRVIALGQEAVALAPREKGIWINLGWAYYLAGEWQLAREALERAEQLPIASAANFHEIMTKFLLAMTDWQSGDKERARAGFQKAVELMKDRTDPPLRMLRDDARRLLGIAPPPPEQKSEE
jgi:tetratricopeptide (TPR) repeat protein